MLKSAHWIAAKDVNESINIFDKCVVFVMLNGITLHFVIIIVNEHVYIQCD